MSRIDYLVAQLCPDGVEYKRLGEVAKIKNGRDYKGLPEGDIAVYGSGGIMEARVGVSAYDKPTVLLPRKGSISNVFYVDKPFWNIDTAFYTVIDESQLIPRYFYHVMLAAHVENYSTGSAARPSLTQSALNKIEIPVPPMEIQQEIVKVLDSFIRLEAELEAELEARRAQYRYYRDQLLSFERERVQWLTLEECCKRICSGGTPSSKNAAYYGGDVPWIRTQDIDYTVISTPSAYITQAGLESCSAKWIPENSVIVAMYGATAAKVAMTSIPVTTNQACCNLIANDEIALPRYLFHWIASQYQQLKALGEGSQNNISASKVRKFLIPVPSLDTQRQIVDILDRFDDLTTSLTDGLPAEIEARRQQYAYYRDRLLALPRKSS